MITDQTDIREGFGPKFYFKYNAMFARTIGVWPYQSKSSALFNVSLWIFQEVVLAIAEAIKFCEIYTNADLVLEAIPPFLYNRGNDMLLTNGLIQKDKVKGLLDKIQVHYDSLTDESEMQILDEGAKFAHFFNLAYVGLIYGCVFQCMAFPLIPVFMDLIQPLNESRKYEPLFMVEFFVDQDKYFYTILLHNYVSVIASPIPIIAMDLIFMNCVNHMCGMINILGYRIDNISRLKDLKSDSKKSEYKQLCDCITMHQGIFEFCDEINDAFSTSFLFVLFINMVDMSVTGMVVVVKMDDFSQFNDILRFTVFTVTQIFHLFCFNYTGQTILNAIESLDLKIYNVQWYELSIKSQVLVQLMMMKNYRPAVMQAVLFPLCLETFTSVAKTSMSYFTVLKSTR